MILILKPIYFPIERKDFVHKIILFINNTFTLNTGCNSLLEEQKQNLPVLNQYVPQKPPSHKQHYLPLLPSPNPKTQFVAGFYLQ